MRIHFKTRYDQDIRLFEDRWHFGVYAVLLLAAIAMPFVLGDYLLGELISVLIWAIAGMGLMVLAGHTGQATR